MKVVKKFLKAFDYVLIAFFLLAYAVLDDIVPTFIDNIIAGLNAAGMLYIAIKQFKNIVKEEDKEKIKDD